MEAGIRLMLREGREAVFRRHAEAARAARKRLSAMGLGLVADDATASNTVTAAWLPAGVSWPELSRTLQERHGIVLAGGLGRLAGKILRLGHLAGRPRQTSTAPRMRSHRTSARRSAHGNAGQFGGGLQTGTAARRAARPRTAEGEKARGRLGTPTSGRHSGPQGRGGAGPNRRDGSLLGAYPSKAGWRATAGPHQENWPPACGQHRAGARNQRP